ncbi:hypothetical protein Tco_0535156 [Tanacetum coccineum]
MMMIVPVAEVYVEALQVKYPIIDWEDLVKERFSTTEPTDDKEKKLWVELKRLFEPIVYDNYGGSFKGITSITDNVKNAYELKGKFLDDLHKNAFSDPDDENLIDEDEVAEIFRIETNIFDFETPLCRAFKEFNYLLQIDPNVLTKDIDGFKTYEEYKNNWIYEWNKDVPWVHEIPWTENGVWKEPTPVKHHCKPFNYKSGCSEWPTYSWKDDGYCNGGNLPGYYIIGNILRYQDLEWYEALKDGKLKEEALKNKAIMEGMIGEDEKSSNEGWRRWGNFDNTNHDNEGSENVMKKEDEERSDVFDDHEPSICNIRRFEMIKYSFRDGEEYVAIKENEYDDLTNTRMEAIHAYQEIFRMMDGGWMVTCTSERSESNLNTLL